MFLVASVCRKPWSFRKVFFIQIVEIDESSNQFGEFIRRKRVNTACNVVNIS